MLGVSDLIVCGRLVKSDLSHLSVSTIRLYVVFWSEVNVVGGKASGENAGSQSFPHS